MTDWRKGLHGNRVISIIIALGIVISIVVIGIFYTLNKRPEDTSYIDRNYYLNIMTNGTYEIIAPCPINRTSGGPIAFQYIANNNNVHISQIQRNETWVLFITGTGGCIITATLSDTFHWVDGSGYVSDNTGLIIEPMGLTMTQLINSTGINGINNASFHNSWAASEPTYHTPLEKGIIGESTFIINATIHDIDISFYISEKIIGETIWMMWSSVNLGTGTYNIRWESMEILP